MARNDGTAAKTGNDSRDVTALLDGIDWSIARPPDVESLRSVEGWQEFRASRTPVARPPLLTRAEHSALKPADKAMYDLARSTWHANLPKFDTPMAARVMDEIRLHLQVDMMKRDPGVRRGIIVSANSNHGKTTVVLEALAQHEDLLAEMYRRSASSARVRDRHIPVVAVTCPARATVSKLCHRLLTFFGMAWSARDNEGDLSDKVRTCLEACGTKALFIDEISRLNMTREDAQITFDFIRDLQDSSATVILAGVDIESTGLLTEGLYLRKGGDLKTQTEARFTRLPLPKFTRDNAAGIRDWVDHLRAVEDQLLLLDKHEGMLSRDHADWLFDHTDEGVIGSLRHVVEHACARAVERGRRTGVEVIDLEILERGALDWASEKRRRAVQEGEDRGEQPRPSARYEPGSRKTSGKRRKATDGVYDAKR